MLHLFVNKHANNFDLVLLRNMLLLEKKQNIFVQGSIQAQVAKMLPPERIIGETGGCKPRVYICSYCKWFYSASTLL